MILDNGAGTRLNLHIAWSTRGRGSRKVEPRDSLAVTVDVETPHGRWSAQDDLCLTLGDAFTSASWLQALGHGRRQPDRLSFLEPNISFERRWDAPPAHLRLRIGLEMEMEPPEAISAAYGLEDEDFFLEFVLSPDQVIDAGISLEREVHELLAEAGVGSAGLFPRPTLAPTFFIDWTVLPRDAATREDAIEAVRAYMEQRDIPIEIEGAEPGDGWLVRGRTNLPVPSDDSAEAVYHFVTRVPIPRGKTHIDRARLTTGGAFSWTVAVVPEREPDSPFPFEDIRWRATLTNFGSEDQIKIRLLFAYIAGEIDSRGRPRRS